LNKKVLVVDDEPMNRELFRGYLEMEGYEVLEASNAEEGRELLILTEPDLILLDVMMPGEDGFSLCKFIKENWQEPFLPVVLVTALHDKENRIKGLSAGADDFLSKPLDRLELTIKARNMLRIRELHQNLYHELIFANQVQRSLFLDHSSVKQGDFLLYLPYRQVSGDLIELWEKDGERWGFLADATGHGPSAALISVAVKALLNKSCSSPGELLEELNEKLYRLLTNNDLGYYVTGICVKATADELLFAGGGHPAGYLKNKNKLTPLVSKQLPIGLVQKLSFEETQLPLSKEDLVILYSDGLLELLSEQELEKLLLSEKNKEELYQELKKLTQGASMRDDLSLLAFSF